MRLHSRVRRGLAVAALAMAGVGMAASPAYALPPSNDDPSSPEPLPFGSTVVGDTTEATADIVSSCQAQAEGGNSVWYHLSLPGPTDLRLTLSSASDQGVALFDLALSELGCRDSFLGGTDEVLDMPGMSPGDYLVSVSRWDVGDEGPFQLTASTFQPPNGDGPLEITPFVEFGQVPLGQSSQEMIITFFNNGEFPAQIVNLLQDGGMNVQWGSIDTCSQTNLVIEPFSSCDLSVVWTADSVGGQQSTWQWIYSAGPEGQQYQEPTTFSGEGVDEEPPPEVPEAPMAILLPGSTALLGGAIFAIRRRNSNKTVEALEV